MNQLLIFNVGKMTQLNSFVLGKMFVHFDYDIKMKSFDGTDLKSWNWNPRRNV